MRSRARRLPLKKTLVKLRQGWLHGASLLQRSQLPGVLKVAGCFLQMGIARTAGMKRAPGDWPEGLARTDPFADVPELRISRTARRDF